MDRFQHRQSGPPRPDRGYDRGMRGAPAGYDRGYRAYDRDMRPAPYDRGYGAPRGWSSYAAAFPTIPFGVDPLLGPVGWQQMPYGGYVDRRPPTPPRQSPMYGRGGDQALREWAQRYGYDVEYTIPPRRGPRRPY